MTTAAGVAGNQRGMAMPPNITKSDICILLAMVQRDHEAMAAQLQALAKIEEAMRTDLRYLAERLRQWEECR